MNFNSIKRVLIYMNSSFSRLKMDYLRQYLVFALCQLKLWHISYTKTFPSLWGNISVVKY